MVLETASASFGDIATSTGGLVEVRCPGFFHHSVTRSIGCSLGVTIGMAIGVPVCTSVDKFIGSTVGSHLEQGDSRSVREELTI